MTSAEKYRVRLHNPSRMVTPVNFVHNEVYHLVKITNEHASTWSRDRTIPGIAVHVVDLKEHVWL